MKLPQAFLESLEGVKGFDRESFIKVHNEGGQVTSIRINQEKVNARTLWTDDKDLKLGQIDPATTPLRIPWTEFGYYLPERPSFTFDPLFHAGCYYVQDASSMFLEQAMGQ
ncbi:MAG TPA: hypothetical protein VJ499_10840, partial [Flavisolibacter sp.]|nr:hypothetical protein [Flavisolibacter sp.]